MTEEREARLSAAMERMDRDGPLPGMIAAFEKHFGQDWTDPAWRSEASVWAAAWRAALAAPPEQAAQPAAQAEPVKEPGEIVLDRIQTQLGMCYTRHQLIQVYRAAVSDHPPGHAPAVPVGEVSSMPGATGFGVVVVKLSDVPLGTKVYATPPAPTEQSDTVPLPGTVRFDIPADECFSVIGEGSSYPMHQCMDCQVADYGPLRIDHKADCRVAAARAAQAKGGSHA